MSGSGNVRKRAGFHGVRPFLFDLDPGPARHRSAFECEDDVASWLVREPNGAVNDTDDRDSAVRPGGERPRDAALEHWPDLIGEVDFGYAGKQRVDALPILSCLREQPEPLLVCRLFR